MYSLGSTSLYSCFLKPADDKGSLGFSGEGQKAEVLKQSFTNNVTSLARSFLSRAFEKTGIQANINQLDNGNLEISPKRSILPFIKKVAIPNEVLEARVQELNSYCTKKSLGQFKYSQKNGIYLLEFIPAADSRAIGTFLSSPRDPLLQMLAESNLGLVREASKKDAFIFHQALKLLDGTQQKFIFSCADPQKQSISVKFDSNVFADQFFKQFNDLQESNPNLFIDLGLSAKRSSSSTDYFEIKFQPLWDSATFLDSDKWCTEANMAAVEAAFNVYVRTDTLD